MTEAEVAVLVERAAKKAVEETLLTLGIDADDPIAFQKDMAHLRAWRESKETVVRQGLLAAVGIVVAGALGLLWLGLKGQ